MFKKTSLLSSIVAASIASASISASAAELYAGGNFAVLDAEELTLNAIYGRFGALFNENLSAEARIGFGVGDDTWDGEKYEIDNFYGAYVRGGIPVGEVFYPYAIVGYTKGKISSSGPFGSDSASESDFSFGVGADFKVTDTLKINAEYLSYLDKDEAELTGFSVGVSFSF
jgi:hypothetical protein